MKRLLFTIPDHVARDMQEFVPSGERSQFVVRYIEIPLQKLKKQKKKKKTASSIYKAGFLRDIKEAQEQVKRGEVYSHEEVMKELGLLWNIDLSIQKEPSMILSVWIILHPERSQGKFIFGHNRQTRSFLQNSWKAFQIKYIDFESGITVFFLSYVQII